MQIVISSTSVDQNWFVRNHIKRLKHYALYLILLKYKIYILGRTQMSIIMVTMPHNFGRGFIIITFIYAKNILAKVSRVLSLDNLVRMYSYISPQRMMMTDVLLNNSYWL